jgi:5-methylcytosine-specific restriction protein A
MARKAWRECNKVGCHELTKERFCEKCQKEYDESIKEKNKEYDKQRGSSTARGYNYRWQKARKVYLKNNPLCVECQANGIVKEAKHVDHKIPHKGDTRLFWDVRNWQPLCVECHSRKTATEDGGFGNNA